MNLNPRIALAFVAGLVMVGGSYLLAENREDAKGESSEIVTKESVRSFIKEIDGDQDGLPDWQNTFNLNTINLDGSDSSEEMTETAAFAAELASGAYGGADPATLLGGISSTVTRSILDDQYDQTDILTSTDNSQTALRAYGNAVARVVIDNAPPTGTEDELTILNRALIRNDAETLAKLEPTIASYEKMAADMLKIPVPSSLTREHLSLTNVYQALANDIKAFRHTFTDALPALNRFRRYQADAEALYLAVSALYLKLDQNGIKWTDADIASRFIKIE